MIPRSRLIAGLLLVLALALAPLGAVPSRAEPGPSDRGKAVAVTPAQPMAGERTRFSGRVGAATGRATLERKKGKRWVAVARGKVRKGRYQLDTRVHKAGIYRVRAGGFTSKRARVRLAPQAAQLSVGTPFVVGLGRPVTATVTPARAGRTVRLERLDGATWTTVGTATSEATGQVRFGYAGGPVGTTSYRVVGDAHHGSAGVASAAQPVRTAASPELVSPATSPGDDSHDPAVSADGRWVAFTSESRLLPSDTDDYSDVYLFDRISGTLSHPVAAATGHVLSPLLSADGRFLAFQSDAFDLAGEPGYDHDVFVLDRASGAIDLVSQTPGGVAANRPSDLYAMSDDGRFVAFTSPAADLVTNLPPPDTDVRHAYLHDRTTGVNRGLDRTGLGWSDVNIFNLDLSADGTRAAFSSSDTDLDPGDVDGSAVFAWDIAADGAISNRTNLTPDIDADSPSLGGTGDELAFTTDEALSLSDLNGSRDTYLRTVSGTFLLAGPYGAAGNPGGTLSDDGRFVSMGTKNVLPGDTNGGQADVVVWERATGTSTLVTRAGAGASGEAELSADGSVLVFGSAAAVVPGATGAYNVYVQVLR
ncbi:hypothetical protein RB608_14635 [Nocardioides sp. LHD-245]|uniref:hypothetical protein n=1 Tax=Nocardioides sp. LHD-245 TaxID=3051387 RepID=UPI0027E014B6|nr:hypothetical protein [Nocardioides sp. LHD-245]